MSTVGPKTVVCITRCGKCQKKSPAQLKEGGVTSKRRRDGRPLMPGEDVPWARVAGGGEKNSLSRIMHGRPKKKGGEQVLSSKKTQHQTRKKERRVKRKGEGSHFPGKNLFERGKILRYIGQDRKKSEA